MFVKIPSGVRNQIYIESMFVKIQKWAWKTQSRQLELSMDMQMRVRADCRHSPRQSWSNL